MLKSPVIINSWGVVAANDRKELSKYSNMQVYLPFLLQLLKNFLFLKLQYLTINRCDKKYLELTTMTNLRITVETTRF